MWFAPSYCHRCIFNAHYSKGGQSDNFCHNKSSSMTPDNLLVSLERKTCKTRFNIFVKWARKFCYLLQNSCLKSDFRPPVTRTQDHRLWKQRPWPQDPWVAKSRIKIDWEPGKQNVVAQKDWRTCSKIESRPLNFFPLSARTKTRPGFCLVWKEASGNNGPELEMVRLSFSNTFNEPDVQLHHGGM